MKIKQFDLNWSLKMITTCHMEINIVLRYFKHHTSNATSLKMIKNTNNSNINLHLQIHKPFTTVMIYIRQSLESKHFKVSNYNTIFILINCMYKYWANLIKYQGYVMGKILISKEIQNPKSNHKSWHTLYYRTSISNTTFAKNLNQFTSTVFQMLCSVAA